MCINKKNTRFFVIVKATKILDYPITFDIVWMEIFKNYCYENAMAERVNGILKNEFYLDQTFTNKSNAKRAVKNAFNLYNEVRLHLSLDFKTPNMVYKLSA